MALGPLGFFLNLLAGPSSESRPLLLPLELDF